MYQFYLSSDRKLLPFSGGYMEQPGGVMQGFRQLDRKCLLIKKLREIDRKAQEQLEKLEEFEQQVAGRGDYDD